MKKVLLCLSVVTFILFTSCSKDPEPAVTKLSPLEEPIPFDVLGEGKLVFTRGSNAYVIDADNQTTWGLTSGYGMRRSMISSDGSYITFSKQTNHNQTETYVVEVDGTDARNVSNSIWDCNPLGWAANSKDIIFEEYPDDYVLYLQSIEGDNRSIIMTYPFPYHFNSIISVSKTNKCVFSFRSYYESTGKVYDGIFTMDLDGNNLVQLPTPDSLIFKYKSPVWSPSGEMIAYIENNYLYNVNRTIEIILINADGTNRLSIGVFDRGFESIFGPSPSLCWSPDGSKIAFTMYEQSGIHIYTINKDGTNFTQITSADGSDDSWLSWSSE
jgi:Tol biopolymer transport system component